MNDFNQENRTHDTATNVGKVSITKREIPVRVNGNIPSHNSTVSIIV